MKGDPVMAQLVSGHDQRRAEMSAWLERAWDDGGMIEATVEAIKIMRRSDNAVDRLLGSLALIAVGELSIPILERVE